MPASMGRVLGAALAEQQQQLDELASLLSATAAVAGAQAVQIVQLQARAAAAERDAAGGSGQCRLQHHVDGSSGGGTAAWSLPAAARAAGAAAGVSRTRPATASPTAASRSRRGRPWEEQQLLQRPPSPPAGLAKRPATAADGGSGMMRVLRADVEAWRAR